MPPSRRDELVEAAIAVFNRHGFHGAGIERVLAEAGISRMTLYNHFASKDDLIVAALRRHDERFRTRLAEHVEAHSDDPIEQIMSIFDVFDAWFRAPDFAGCLFVAASAEFSADGGAICRVAAEHKAQMLAFITARCRAAGLDAPEDVAMQLVLLLEGAVAAAQVCGAREGVLDAARRAARTIIGAAA